MHKLWIRYNRPRAGVINTTGLNLKAKNEYKVEYKRALTDFEEMHADVTYDHLMEKYTNSSWRALNSKYNKSSEMSGVNNTSEIASAFKDYYSNIFVKSSDDIASISEYFDLINGIGATISDKLPCINVELVEICNKQLKIGKSAGADSIAAEHITIVTPV